MHKGNTGYKHNMFRCISSRLAASSTSLTLKTTPNLIFYNYITWNCIVPM